jgi:hypothetical protein
MTLASLLLVLLLSACSTSKVVFHTPDGNVPVAVEIADTNEERATGLMNRESLGENSGMLFVFDAPAPLTFWMKDTLIPLDMIFIGADKKVVEVKPNIQPCRIAFCPTYPGIAPAQYVVEVNAGFAAKNGIVEGTVVTIPT